MCLQILLLQPESILFPYTTLFRSLRSQALDRAQLQLLDGSFALAEALGNFSDAPLIHKTLLDDAALRFRKRSEERRVGKECRSRGGACRNTTKVIGTV